MYGLFVENISKENDKYGFFNEYAVRLSTGFALVLAIYSFISILFFGMFNIPMIFIGLIWLDFLIKVFVNPLYSPFLLLANLFIKKTYYVGAVQKRFAWSIGVFLSTFAFLCILIISGVLVQWNICVPLYEMVQALPVPNGLAVPITPPLVACIICIFFMILESVFGYCVGCKIYQKLVQWKVLKEIKGQNCVGGVCKI